MAQSEVFFLLRQTHDTDLKRCMEYVNSEVATREQIARFAPGQGVYLASDGTQIVTRFHQRRSSGERSQSPQPEAASRYGWLPLPDLPTLSPKTAETMPPLDEVSEPMLMPPLAPARRVQPPAQPVRPPEPTLLERAVMAYRNGATSQPRLAAALDISAWEARKLMPLVEAEIQRLHEQEES